MTVWLEHGELRAPNRDTRKALAAARKSATKICKDVETLLKDLNK